MFADEVDPAGGRVEVAGLAEEDLKLFLDSFFHIGILFSVDLQR
jgi:hypothetical protein